jgi:acyl-CoA synthetase (NDP forming)/GNAT superfamily N-acetyltransferase
VVVRRLGPPDHEAVASLHRAMPLDDRYLRFFTVSRPDADRIASSVVGERSVAYGAYRGDRLLGVAHYIRGPGEPDPEVAIAVAHAEQHRGVASLLLEHLLGQAAAEGVPRLRADALARNHDVLRVLDDSGISVMRRADGDVVEILLDVRAAAGEPYVLAVLERAATADVASLRPLLEPRSVALLGAQPWPSAAHRVLRAIAVGGFTGPVHAAGCDVAVAGAASHQRLDDLPAVDLAVVCTPGASAPGLVERCGRGGIPSVLLISTDAVAPDPVALAAAVTRYGVRLLGPTTFGLISTDPQIRLRATPAPGGRVGEVGLAVASDAVALALTAEIDRLGLGTSTAVGTGDGPDVGCDDMLLWWAVDARTRAAVLQEQRLRRPRQFVRLARRLARRIPVLALLADGPVVASGRRADVRGELLGRAGVLAVEDVAEVPGLLALLCRQPVPAGRRTAVLSAVAGGGDLAAEACRRHGLEMTPLAATTRAAVVEALPAAARVENPVEVPDAAAAALGRALDALLADPDVDAVLVLTAADAHLDDGADHRAPRAGNPKPVVAVRWGQPERVALLGPPYPAPAFDSPECAARALATAARRADWLRRPDEAEPAPADVDWASARRLVLRCLESEPGGGLLPLAAAADLARAAGMDVLPVDAEITAPEPGPRFTAGVTVDERWGGVLAVRPDRGAEACCLLPPAAADLDDLTAHALPTPAGATLRVDLRDVLARLAWLGAVLPELAAVEVDTLFVGAGRPLVGGLHVRLAPVSAVRPWSRDLPL